MAPPSAPSLDKTTRVVIGDVVSVAVGVFGQEYAEARGARPWRSEAVRDEGTIVTTFGSFALLMARRKGSSERLSPLYVVRLQPPQAGEAGQIEHRGESSLKRMTRMRRRLVDIKAKELSSIPPTKMRLWAKRTTVALQEKWGGCAKLF
ncbi:hypothetical protein AB1Y20_002038 [Prymnesium parvum]|uniref:Uncharacterized protein n=1 Tax=Prymnesium parvum TaxID=97485 RepID=A0AB34J8A7_PRYPA